MTLHDIFIENEKLRKEWHSELNGSLTPSDVSAGSRKKVWWRCEKGHEWQSMVYLRANLGTGCPYCTGRKPFPGETDLATLKPELAEEWHSELNGSLTPSDVSCGSTKRVWWRCKKGHEWQARIDSRAGLGSGCPYCSGLKPIKGENDLATTNPKLAKEWHPERNGDLGPSDVTPGSARKVWWLCEKGHEWQSYVVERVNHGSGCPYCSSRNPIKGETDLATLKPELAKEWHPTLNGDLSPSDIALASAKKVWWLCEKGHEWQAMVANRSKLKSGCPYCTGRIPIPGETDLATTNPELLKEWHTERNGDLRPSDVTAGSGKKVWWRCELGHEWQAFVYYRARQNRARQGGGTCPACNPRRRKAAKPPKPIDF